MHLSNSLNCINFQSGKERVKEERGVRSWEPSYPQGNSEIFSWVEGGWTECQITKVRGSESHFLPLRVTLKSHQSEPCDPCTHLSCLESFPFQPMLYLFLRLSSSKNYFLYIPKHSSFIAWFPLNHLYFLSQLAVAHSCIYFWVRYY